MNQPIHGPVKMFAIRLDCDLIRQVHLEALRRNIPLRQLVDQAFRAYLPNIKLVVGRKSGVRRSHGVGKASRPR